LAPCSSAELAVGFVLDFSPPSAHCSTGQNHRGVTAAQPPLSIQVTLRSPARRCLQWHVPPPFLHHQNRFISAKRPYCVNSSCAPVRRPMTRPDKFLSVGQAFLPVTRERVPAFLPAERTRVTPKTV
jgi:hypothetical protein